MSVIKKLKDLIIAKFSKDEQAELEKLSKPIEVKMKDVKTKDGAKTLSYDGESPAIDMPIMDSTTGAPVACADGSYTLEDGTVLTVAAGKITAVTPGVTETPEQLAAKKAAELANPVLAQMSVQMKADKENFDKTVSALKKENVELKKQIQLTAKAIDIILNTPIQNASQEERVEKKFEDMTKYEQVKFNRGEKIYV